MQAPRLVPTTDDLDALRERRDILREIVSLQKEIDKAPLSPQPLLTVTTLAEYWRVSTSFIYSLMETKRLPYYKIGACKFEWQDVQNYMALYGCPEPTVPRGRKKTKAQMAAAQKAVYLFD